jgi:pimeloyl-ACP methyl ester carboxylesterase
VHPAQTVIFTTSDGVPIVADHWPGAGLAYVVAHGFTGSRRIPRVRRIATQLAASGAAVLALDFRGHGGSGGYSTAGHLEVRDLAAAVAFLRDEGHAAIATLGWSMGGSAVLRYAGLGGDVDAVVSVSSPGHWWERGTWPMRAVHWAVETRTGRLVTRLATRTRVASDWPELPESPVEVVAAIAPRPLLIVHGDSDHYFPVRHAEALVAASGAEFWLEIGMGHAESATTPELVERIDAWVRAALPAVDSTGTSCLRP